MSPKLLSSSHKTSTHFNYRGVGWGQWKKWGARVPVNGAVAQMLLSSHPCLLNQLYIQDSARVKAQGKRGRRQQCRNAWAKHADKSHLHMEMHDCVVSVCLLSVFIFMQWYFCLLLQMLVLHWKSRNKKLTHSLYTSHFSKMQGQEKKWKLLKDICPSNRFLILEGRGSGTSTDTIFILNSVLVRISYSKPVWSQAKVIFLDGGKKKNPI